MTRRSRSAMCGWLLTAALAATASCAREREPAPAESPPSSSERSPALSVKVYFRRGDGCEVVPVARQVTGRRPIELARAALESLLQGPTEEEVSNGLSSALPDRERVWRYRQSHAAFEHDSPYGGEEVRILEVREETRGVLYVDFSAEIEAFGGGADRLCALIRQVNSTVKQFAEYQGARIAVEGRSQGVLQP